MFIELNVKTKEDKFMKALINIDLVFTMERHDDLTILFVPNSTVGNACVKETREEIMQLIKELKMIKLTQEQAEAVWLIEHLKRENVIRYFGDWNKDFNYAKDRLEELGVEIEGEENQNGPN